MNNALRGGISLLICLLAVIPCGAALTILGTLGVDAFKIIADQRDTFERLKALAVPALWASAGIAGCLSLIYGVDKLMTARTRLGAGPLFGIVVGLVAASLFSTLYAMRLSSGWILRVLCVAPAAIEWALLLIHFFRFWIGRKNPGPSTASASPAAKANPVGEQAQR